MIILQAGRVIASGTVLSCKHKIESRYPSDAEGCRLWRGILRLYATGKRSQYHTEIGLELYFPEKITTFPECPRKFWYQPKKES